MAQTDTQVEKPAAFSLFPAGLTELGKKRTDAIMAAQHDLLNEAQELNQHWLERAKSEGELAAEFVNTLTAARSVPESLTAWQQWTSRRMQMAVEDSQRGFADGCKLMETYARLFSNGGASARP